MDDRSVPFELRTPRLHLVRLGAAHLDDLVDLDSDPEVMRYINGGVPVSRETYVETLLPRITQFDDRPYGFAAAYVEGAFAGWFHLRPSVADPEILELGYRLRRAYWGRGLATEGGRALVRHAFDTLEQTAVDACAMPDNHASIAVMRKCGMQEHGRFVHPRAACEVVRWIVFRSSVEESLFKVHREVEHP